MGVIDDNIEVALEALDADEPLKVLEQAGVRAFGRFTTYSESELSELESALEVTQRYLGYDGAPRPLCIAAFGPPGSGKSFAVEQLHELVSAYDKKIEVPLTTLNLTQIDGPVALAEALARIAGERNRATVPFVFFDEFDCSLNGAELGWLSWFLAPMNDGKFIHGGAGVTLDRAVFAFAGGTASTFRAFANPAPERAHDFRSAKGPDFVSRLRVTLDVAGPNDEPRALRRAPILAFNLKKAGVRVSPELAKSMLGQARFRHGARSIGAIIDVSNPSKREPMNFDHLPKSREVLGLHIDRGPLDPARVSGHLTMSGGGATSKQQRDCWEKVAKALLLQGATLAYGGKAQRGLTKALATVVESLADPLSHPETERSHRVPRLRLMPPDYTKIDSDDLPQYTTLEPVAGLTRDELESIDGKKLRQWWERVLGLFRMRLAIAESAIGCVALGGGAPDPAKRRMAGVAEEILIHAVLGRPVYVLGGFGGSAAIAGARLGLERPWVGNTDGLFPDLSEEQRAWMASNADKLRPPPWRALPTDDAAVLEAFEDHALGTACWPPNGLSVEDNRRLFASTDPLEISGLISLGLTTRYSNVSE